MSHRSPQSKQLARLREKVNRQPLPRLFDPVEYLVTRRLAPTKRAAMQLIKDGRLRSGSHVVGRIMVPVPDPTGKMVEEPFVAQAVPAALKDDLHILPAEDVA